MEGTGRRNPVAVQRAAHASNRVDQAPDPIEQGVQDDDIPF